MATRVPAAGVVLLTLVALLVTAAVWPLATAPRTANGRVTPAAGPEIADISNRRRLAWIDRSGRMTPMPAPSRGYAYPRLSPDLRRVALDVRDGKHGLWLWDVGGTTLSPLAVGRASHVSPVWSHAGAWLLFSRGRGVAPELFRLDVGSDHRWPDSTRPIPPTRLPAESNSLLMPSSLTPDDRHVIVTASVATGFDLLVIDLQGDGRPMPLVATAADELNGELSPDGQWLAYQSRSSGQFEIWVKRWSTDGVGRRLTTTGGTRPVWTRGGRELVYLTHAGEMMALAVAPGPTPDVVTIGAPQRLFTADVYRDLAGRTFDVSPDGERFLVVIGLERQVGTPSAPEIR